MSRSDRFEQILALLGQQRYMSVEALCEKLFVSPSTLRRDLAQMSRSGYLVRTRGGAAAMTSAEENERIVHNQPLDFTPAQRAIAARAASPSGRGKRVRRKVRHSTWLSHRESWHGASRD